MAKPKTLCTHCQKKTVRQHAILGHPLCWSCEKANPALYKCVTKTTAKKDFRLKDHDLEDLDFIEVRNPHYRSAGAPMRLYLLTQIVELYNSREACA